MKHILSILVLLFVFSSYECNGQKKQKRTQLKQIHIQRVKECIQKDSLFIEITRINPLGTTPQSSSFSYFVRLENKKASVYLPYMGKMTTAVLGGEKLAIEAKEQTVSIQKEIDEKNECTYYLFYFVNDNRKERWECVFQVYHNGHTILKLSCPGRDPIGFHGNVKIN